MTGSAARLLAGAFFVSLITAWTGSASATPLSAAETLSDFNVVVFENLNSRSNVAGRSYVGGDLTGNSANFFTHGNKLPASDQPALIVGGSITGGSKQVNHGGDLMVGGNLWTQVNMNGRGTRYVAGQYVQQNGSRNSTVQGPVSIPDPEQSLRDLSTGLSGLDSNSAATRQGSRAIFASQTSSSIFSIEDGGDFFGSIGEIEFALGLSDTLIVNVGGLHIDIAENFLGEASHARADSIIWNFFEAEVITFRAEFFGSVLAPYAGIVNMSPINGTVVARSFTQNAEVRGPSFSGALPDYAGGSDNPSYEVPEPGTLLLFGAGLVALPFVLRRRKSAITAR